MTQPTQSNVPPEAPQWAKDAIDELERHFGGTGWPNSMKQHAQRIIARQLELELNEANRTLQAIHLSYASLSGYIKSAEEILQDQVLSGSFDFKGWLDGLVEYEKRFSEVINKSIL